ncbi:MAG: hypothetical protein IJL44_04640 [Bacteroidales bacterium]|nr:hypothetical protein [Bacteroidales bacterium]
MTATVRKTIVVSVIASEERAWQSTIVNSGLPPPRFTRGRLSSVNFAPRNDSYRAMTATAL